MLYLKWLRNYTSIFDLSLIFNVSASTIRNIINQVLPILYKYIPSTKWPTSFEFGFNGTVGAIDCTSHFRNRIHPGQALLYRGDKHAHFITAQVVCSLEGNIWSVHLCYGHNNDKGVFNLTNVKSRISHLNVELLADRGYNYSHLVTPLDGDDYWRTEHARHRSIVEIVIGYVKNWKFTSSKVTQELKLHLMGLMVVYKIANLSLLHDKPYWRSK